ncbi:hypothetical protein BpHYR1_004499 [Brachionus plicatilis]|uniref:Uncharacterized protein n=1 Tax=Brachionus plicatilis TaxID=10195 RepID=A0A3M7SJG2_BRAPC|nr:hypothetical protein BpHYR1_004499 [Brachionus plicatilis]
MNLPVYEAVKQIEYCSSFEKIDDIFDSEKGFNYFARFSRGATKVFFDESEFMKICEENSFYEFFNYILCSSASNIQLSIVKDYAYFEDILHLHETTSHNERKVFFLLNILKLINRFIASIKFRKILIEKNGLKTHLNLIKVLNEERELFNKRYFGVVILNVNWLSKLADEHKNIWTDLKAIDILTNYMKNFEFYKIYLIMILSNIADDKDLESLPEFDLAIEIFTKMSIECIRQPSKF